MVIQDTSPVLYTLRCNISLILGKPGHTPGRLNWISFINNASLSLSFWSWIYDGCCLSLALRIYRYFKMYTQQKFLHYTYYDMCTIIWCYISQGHQVVRSSPAQKQCLCTLFRPLVDCFFSPCVLQQYYISASDTCDFLELLQISFRWMLELNFCIFLHRRHLIKCNFYELIYVFWRFKSIYTAPNYMYAILRRILKAHFY